MEPPLARFSTWYELFPALRVAGPGAPRDVPRRHRPAPLRRRPRLRRPVPAADPPDRGDVPEGPQQRHRSDAHTIPGVPWAIGSADGGHDAIHPEPRARSRTSGRSSRRRTGQGIAIALDIAFQASPDHPWVREHPTWFRQRPDGTVQYAENPPKKYQDIYPFDFESDDWPGLWAALEGVLRHWIAQGVRVFRVDNPHTKAFPFWEWVIARIKADHPEHALPRRGLHPTAGSCTAWRRSASTSRTRTSPGERTKQELADYLARALDARPCPTSSGRTSGRTRPTSCTPPSRRAGGRCSRPATSWPRRPRPASASTDRRTSWARTRRASRAARSTSTPRSTSSGPGTSTTRPASPRSSAASTRSGARTRRSSRNAGLAIHDIDDDQLIAYSKQHRRPLRPDPHDRQPRPRPSRARARSSWTVGDLWLGSEPADRGRGPADGEVDTLVERQTTRDQDRSGRAPGARPAPPGTGLMATRPGRARQAGRRAPPPGPRREPPAAGDRRRGALVQGRDHLRGAGPRLPRQQRRRDRRLPGPDREARLHPRPRRHRDLAPAVLPVAAPRRRLRHRRLHRRPPRLRDAARRQARSSARPTHRGLRVITELVCNHTSDQHAWFQRARRAKPGHQRARLLRLERRRRTSTPTPGSSSRTRRPRTGRGTRSPARTTGTASSRTSRTSTSTTRRSTRRSSRRWTSGSRWAWTASGSTRSRTSTSARARTARTCPRRTRSSRSCARHVDDELPGPDAPRRGEPVARGLRRVLRRRRRVQHGLPLPGHAADVHGDPDRRTGSRSSTSWSRRRRSPTTPSGRCSCATTTS